MERSCAGADESPTNLVECDSTSQPKREEEEEPVHASDGNEEQIRVVKLEDFQRACLMVEEAQERVDFLENLLDKKPDIKEDELNEVDELQIRNVCLTQQLLAERSRANQNELKLMSVTRQLETEKSRMSEERKRAYARMDDLNRELSEEVRKNHDDKMNDRASIRALKDQLEEVDKSRRIYQERIDELTRRLAQYEKVEVEKVPPKTLLELKTHSPRPSRRELKTNNILLLCNPTKTKTIDYESAVKQLRVFRGFKDKDFAIRRAKVFGGLRELKCLSCRKKLQCVSVLDHFVSYGHAEMVRAHKAEVSLHAFEYWLRSLRKVSGYKEPPCDAPAEAKAPDVSAAIDGVPEEIELVDEFEREEGEIDD